jgi:hypothetical protein
MEKFGGRGGGGGRYTRWGTKRLGERRLNSCGSGVGPTAGSCGHSNESLSSTKDWASFHELLEYHLLSNYLASWT